MNKKISPEKSLEPFFFLIGLPEFSIFTFRQGEVKDEKKNY